MQEDMYNSDWLINFEKATLCRLHMIFNDFCKVYLKKKINGQYISCWQRLWKYFAFFLTCVHVFRGKSEILGYKMLVKKIKTHNLTYLLNKNFQTLVLIQDLLQVGITVWSFFVCFLLWTGFGAVFSYHSEKHNKKNCAWYWSHFL